MKVQGHELETAVERLRSLLSFSGRLLESEGAGLLAVDVECRYVFWNRIMEQMTGMAAREVLGRAGFDVFPFLIETGEYVYINRALGGEFVSSKGHRYMVTERQRDGYYDAYYLPLTNDEGTVIGAAAIIRDITQRHVAEGQLRETESRFRNMADAAPVLLWMSDTDSLCTFFNQTWLDFTGRSLEEEWGVGWAEGIYFEDFQRCMDTYIAAFNARRVFEMEYRLRRRDGEYRWILDRGTPRYTPSGEFAGYIGSCVDITDRKQMESKLLKAVRDRDDFLSIASHELRTPLTTLQLEIERLMRSLDRRAEFALATGRLAKNAEVANMQTSRLITLVDELLDVSRVASGRLEIHPVELDLCELVDDVVQRLRPSLEAAGCPLELAMHTKAIGVWDMVRIEQVITNLLSNAIKYGAGRPIELWVTCEKGSACLRVKDHGIGIAPGDHARIFQRFERAASTSNYGGFGLGLWISREIAAAHGGSIELESSPGAGATFTLRLPLRIS